MGAALAIHTYPPLDKEELKKHFESYQANDGYENGASYSGTVGSLEPGLRIKDMVFENRDEAESYIEENHEKWEKALAVRFKDQDGCECWLVGGWCPE